MDTSMVVESGLENRTQQNYILPKQLAFPLGFQAQGFAANCLGHFF
jgi:hypothetical protein